MKYEYEKSSTSHETLYDTSTLQISGTFAIDIYWNWNYESFIHFSLYFFFKNVRMWLPLTFVITRNFKNAARLSCVF